ncbi:MAG: hypothetical protein AAF531_11945, partial [Actinomycetota bacterium]
MKRLLAVLFVVFALLVSVLVAVPVEARVSEPEVPDVVIAPDLGEAPPEGDGGDGNDEVDAESAGDGLSVDDLLPDGVDAPDVQRLVPSELEPPAVDRDRDVVGPHGEGREVEAAPAGSVRVRPVSTVETPGDGFVPSPLRAGDLAVDVGVGPVGGFEAGSASLDSVGSGRSARFGDGPFGLRASDRIGARASGTVGKGKSALLVPADREFALALSPLGLVGQVRFEGFESGPVLESDRDLTVDSGPGSGWEFEVDPGQLEGLPPGMVDRLAVFVWADCDETGECGIVHELDTSLDAADGVLRAELPAAMVLDQGGLGFGDGAPPAVGGLTIGGRFGRPVMFNFGGGGSSWWTGVAPSTSGASGSYAANDLASLLSWQVGTHTGYAETAYGIPVPPVTVGPVPDVSLSYSSGAVDGMNSSTNNQSGPVGLGWDLSQPVIRRVTRNCA